MSKLFDFVADFGRKLFKSDEEAGEKIKAHIEAQNPGVEQLEVMFQGGFVTLKGKAKSNEAVEKAVLMAGNVQGVGRVVSEIEVPEEETVAPGESPDVEYYTIVKGDTLSAIAKRFYGNANEYPKIFEANREVIQDPDKIFVGQKIRIPVLKK